MRLAIKHKGHGNPRLNADAVAVAVDQNKIVCIAATGPKCPRTYCDGELGRAQEPSADRVARRLLSESALWGASLCAPLPGRYNTASLFSYTQMADDFAVMVGVPLSQVVQQTATLADQHEETAARVVILRVGLEVLGQVRDPFRKESDLDFGRAGITGLAGEFLDDSRFSFCSEGH